jgi:hypothetical protein
MSASPPAVIASFSRSIPASALNAEPVDLAAAGAVAVERVAELVGDLVAHSAAVAAARKHAAHGSVDE